jgi:hypothetical protein
MLSVSDGIYKDLKYPVQIAEVTFSNGTVGSAVFLLKHMFEALLLKRFTDPANVVR